MATKNPICLYNGEEKELQPGDSLPFVGSAAQGATANPTRTETSYAVLDEMILTLTSRGNPLLVQFGGDFQLESGDSFDLSVFLDGEQIVDSERRSDFFGGSLLGLTPARIDSITCSLLALLPVAAGEHTIDVRWKAVTGTARALSTRRTIVVTEI
jgi:hypothetical protein